MAYNLVFEIKKGEKKKFGATVRDASGAAVDLTDCTAHLRVSATGSTDYIINADITVVPDQFNYKGRVEYMVEKAVAVDNPVGDYELDLKVYDGGGQELEFPLAGENVFGTFRILKSKYES